MIDFCWLHIWNSVNPENRKIVTFDFDTHTSHEHERKSLNFVGHK